MFDMSVLHNFNIAVPPQLPEMTNESTEEHKNHMYGSRLHHPTNRVEAEIWIWT